MDINFRTRSTKGFTVIELVIALTLIVILQAVITLDSRQVSVGAQVITTLEQIDKIQVAKNMAYAAGVTSVEWNSSAANPRAGDPLLVKNVLGTPTAVLPAWPIALASAQQVCAYSRNQPLYFTRALNYGICVGDLTNPQPSPTARFQANGLMTPVTVGGVTIM